MPNGQVLEFDRVTKRFGSVTAVADLSVRVEPGRVTGFLGPNGAGKTTSLRILLGQIRPTSGTAKIGDKSYSELRHPLRTVGAVLEEPVYRPRRTATRQLMTAAKANGIPVDRVGEVLRLVGLQEDADTRLGSYSLGMRQRLAVAGALLGDPGVLVLDEPANGLDPEGIRWMRLLMRRLADEGRTVLLSSHVLSEIEQVADDVVVLSRGNAVYSGGMDELADPVGGAVVVDAANRAPLITALLGAKLQFDVLRSGVTVRDTDAATVGAVTTAAGVPLTMLQQRGPSLEEVFLDLIYGRRSDSPRLHEAANPVAHAEPHATGAAVAGGLSVASAAAAVADGGAVAAAGVGYGTSPIDIIPNADADAADADDAERDAEPVQTPEHAGQADQADQTDTADQADAAEHAAESSESSDASDTSAADAADTHPDAAAEGAAATADAQEVGDADGQVETADADGSTSDTAHSEASEADAEPDAAAAAIAALWAPRPAGGAEQPAADADHTDSPSAEADVQAESDDPADEQSDEPAGDAAVDDAQSVDDQPTILPLATEAVATQSPSEVPTFTELITGLPASVAEGIGEHTTATEAIPVYTPIVADDDDDDASVDDADDDPRLAAMRTSLSSAASRFFEGEAPDYPYGNVTADAANRPADSDDAPEDHRRDD